MKHSIVHCLSPAAFGGLETVVQLLASGQRARGHDVVVAPVVDRDDHPFVQRMRAAAIPVMPIVISAKEYGEERRAIARIIRDARATVVHSHGYRPDILDLSAARSVRVPTVSTLHGFTSGDWKVRIYERIQLRMLRKASAVIAVSTGVAERATRRGIAPQRIHLVRNGFADSTTAESRLDMQSARAKLGLSANGVHAVWLGRMAPEKGPDVLVDALPPLQHEPVVISVLGDGPLRAELMARAAKQGSAERIVFHGAIPQGATFLPAFDLLVLSSRSEGTPMVLLEAMAAKIPIVATRVGGIPDMLDSSEALLVPPEDPAALAAAITAVIHDRPAAQRRAEAAYQRLARDFGVDAWIDRHDAIYSQIQL